MAAECWLLASDHRRPSWNATAGRPGPRPAWAVLSVQMEEAPMVRKRPAWQTFNPDQPEAADKERRRDQPAPDAAATVPHPGEGIEPLARGRPRTAASSSIRSTISIVEDLGPEDFEELTDEVEKTGIKTDT